MEDVTRQFIRSLAALNGIPIAEERLDAVRLQYEGFMRTLAQISELPLPRETEPAIGYVVAQPPVASPDGGR